MLYLYTDVYQIDYPSLLSRLRQERGTGFSSQLLRSKIVINKVTLKFAKQWLKDWLNTLISGFAEDYGASLAVLEISDNPIKVRKMGGKNMLSISATINDIDYSRLAEAIREAAAKSNSPGKNTTMLKAIKIVEPFIADTMATIPPSAIAQLIELFAKDKLIELAGDFGIEVKKISVNHT